MTKDKPWELLTFCIETKEGAEATSKRLDHMYKPMLRKLPDGSDLTWSVATMSRFDEPDRAPKPFFISWDDPSKRPDKVSYPATRDSWQSSPLQHSLLPNGLVGVCCSDMGIFDEPDHALTHTMGQPRQAA